MADTKEELVCVREMGYDLTRGKRYAIVARNEAKQQVRVKSDRGRLVWLSNYAFVDVETPVVQLVSWRLDDPIINPLNGWNENNNLVDVVIELDNGSSRWCFFTTPEYLRRLLEPRVQKLPLPPSADVPALYSRHMIVVPLITEEIIEFTLRYMDRQNKLFDHTEPINDLDNVDDENEENRL